MAKSKGSLEPLYTMEEAVDLLLGQKRAEEQLEFPLLMDLEIHQLKHKLKNITFENTKLRNDVDHHQYRLKHYEQRCKELEHYQDAFEKEWRYRSNTEEIQRLGPTVISPTQTKIKDIEEAKLKEYLNSITSQRKK